MNSIRVSCEYPSLIVNRKYSKLPPEVAREFSLYPDYWLQIPCGKCVLCRRRKANEWKVRLSYEFNGTRRHRHNHRLLPRVVFLTFTFRDECYTNSEEIFAEWLVKFRDSFRKRYGLSPRYFAITDRGSQFARLHLHMLLFDPRNYDRKRKEFTRDVSISELKKRSFWWHYGFVDAQWVKYEGVDQYVVGYITGANLEREEPVKHGKPICKEALVYIPRVFVSKGLGASAVDDSFIRMVASRDLATLSLNGFVYALPRYYFDKVVDSIGSQIDGYYKGFDLLGNRKVINPFRDEIVFHRQAIKKAEEEDYLRRHRYCLDSLVFDYRGKRLSHTLFESFKSLTSLYIPPESPVVSESSVFDEYPENPMYGDTLWDGLARRYYTIYEAHWVNPIDMDKECPF